MIFLYFRIGLKQDGIKHFDMLFVPYLKIEMVL